jgi:hypothetical protein
MSTQPTWIGGGKGHVSLDEARRWSLERLAEAEAVAADRKKDEEAAGKTRRQAIAQYDEALRALRLANAEVKRRREDLASRCGIALDAAPASTGDDANG